MATCGRTIGTERKNERGGMEYLVWLKSKREEEGSMVKDR